MTFLKCRSDHVPLLPTSLPWPLNTSSCHTVCTGQVNFVLVFQSIVYWFNMMILNLPVCDLSGIWRWQRQKKKKSCLEVRLFWCKNEVNHVRVSSTTVVINHPKSPPKRSAYQQWRLFSLATCSSNRGLLLLRWQLELSSGLAVGSPCIKSMLLLKFGLHSFMEK